MRSCHLRKLCGRRLRGGYEGGLERAIFPQSAVHARQMPGKIVFNSRQSCSERLPALPFSFSGRFFQFAG
jgi:hypothetical protein